MYYKLVFFIAVFIFIPLSSASAQTAIGSVVTAPNWGCSSTDTAHPFITRTDIIYDVYNTPQSFYPLTQSCVSGTLLVSYSDVLDITLYSTTTMEISCVESVGGVWTKGTIKITGPGTFNNDKNPIVCPGSIWQGGIFANSFILKSNAVAATSTLVSATAASSTLTLTGTGFSPTGNTVVVTSSAGVSVTIPNVSSISSTSMVVTLPSGYTIADTYTVKVLPSGGSLYSNTTSFTIRSVDIAVITVTGAMLSGAICNWVDTNITGPNKLQKTLCIAPFMKSTAKVVKQIKDATDAALAANKKVMIVSQCIGSLIAYNVIAQYYKTYVDKGLVEIVYVDPPYGGSFANALFSRVFPGQYAPRAQAIAGGIKYDSRMIDWTRGEGLLHLFTHDAFTYPNYGKNSTNLAALSNVIQKKVTTLASTSPTPFSPQGGIMIASAPVVSGVSVDGVNSESITTDQDITVNATGLQGDGNYIYIQNNENPQIYYTIYGLLPAGAGDSLIFNLPLKPELGFDVTPGSYSLFVGARDSDLSNSFTINIASPRLGIPPSVTDLPMNMKSGDMVSIQGSGFQPAGNQVRFVLVPNPTQSANVIDLWNVLIDFFLKIKNKLLTLVFAQTISGESLVGFVPDYIIRDIPSNGTSLSFSLPSDIPSGTYLVSVAGPDTNWTPGTATVITNTRAGQSVIYQTSDSVAAQTIYGCYIGYSFDSATNPNASKGYSTNASDLCYYQYGGNKASQIVGYSCPTGYTLNNETKMCLSTQSGPITIGPVVKAYTCPSGHGIVTSNICAYFPTGLWSTAKATYTCPIGYSITGSTCTVSVPTGLTAVSKSIGTVDLSWKNVKTLYADSLVLERATNVAGPFTTIATLSTSSLKYSDKNLSSQEKYSYRVRILRTDGSYSNPTNTVTVSTKAVSVPVITLATKAGTSTIALKLAGKDALLGFNLFGGSTGVMDFIIATTSKTYTVRDLAPSTKYCFVAQAIFNELSVSTSSKALCATTAAVATPVNTTPATTATPAANTAAPTTVSASVGGYTCPTNYTYVSASSGMGNCLATIFFSGPAPTPPIPTPIYTCPSGYVLGTGGVCSK
ncbi:MAG: hypothetical protein RIT04_267 [Candidatus Parcubacteria bacterium]